MALTKVKASNIILTTAAANSNDTTPATTQYVTTAINNLIDGAPATLNTLDEIAAALNDDAALNTTLTNAIAAKLPLAGGTLTGALTGTKAAFSTGSTTDYVLRLDDAGVASYDVTFPDTNTYQLTTNTTSDKTFKLLNSGSGTFKLNVEGDITIPSAKLLVGDIKAIGVGGLALQTDEGTKRLFINDDGKIGIAAGGVIYAGRFSVGKPPSRTPGSVFTSSTSSFFSEATLGNSKGDDQKIAIFGGEDSANVSGLALYRYRRVAGSNWTGDGFSLRQEVDNTENLYDYINFAGGKVGMGTVVPDEFDGRANNLVVQDTGDGGITIVSGDSSDARIAFTIAADTGLSNGQIHYDNNDDSMHFATGGTDRVIINNTAAPGHLSIGYHGATSNNSIAAFHGVGNDATLVLSNNHLTNSASYGWAGRGGRYLHSNGTGWGSNDGGDPALVVGSANASNNRDGIGIALHNESPNDNQFSPAIVFGNKSNSGSYNTAYASIVGKKTGQGADGNWSVGEIHIDTAGSRSGSNTRTTYMDDDPAFRMDSSGDLTMPYRSYAYGQWSGSSFSVTNGTGFPMNVLRSQNMTYQTNATHGAGITVQKPGLYKMVATGLYDPGGTYIYVGWCVNGNQLHHWHSNHTISNNHDYVSILMRQLNVGDHITFENASQVMTTAWGGGHSSWYIVKFG